MTATHPLRNHTSVRITESCDRIRICVAYTQLSCESHGMNRTFVNPRRLPGNLTLFLISVMVGAGVGFSPVLVHRAIHRLPGEFLGGITATTAIGLIVWSMFRFRERIGGARRAALVGLGGGIGISGIVQMASTYRPGMAADFAFVGIISLGLSIIAIGAWGICVIFRGQVFMNDGSMCPGCGHCVLGCESMRCPECGRDFVFEELGTTREEFAERSSLPRTRTA